MTEIVIAGFGGQGVLTAGLILINAAAAQGKQVSWISSYGAEMRGGTANCSVIISDEEIGSPYPSDLDMLIVMNEPSYDKFIGRVREGGYVIVNSSLIKGKDYPDSLTVYEVDATDLANSIGNARGSNVVMLGALIKATNMMDKDLFAKELDNYFAKKGKRYPKNIECYKMGYELAKKV